MKKYIGDYIFIAPFLFIFLIFLAFPVFYALYLSFYKVTDLYNVFGGLRFVGLKNYFLLFKDGRFWWSLLMTFYYAVLSIPAGILFSLVLANLLNNRLKGITIFRGAFFLPYILDVFVVGIVWTFLYSSPYGIVTQLLLKLGIHTGGLLSTSKTAMPSIVLAMMLKNSGFGMILFLATMQNIPPSLYEAAIIDGAGPLTRFKNITIPMLKPLILFMVIIGFIGALSAFAEFYAMTGGGPSVVVGGRSLGATEVTGLYLYRNFEALKLGYAAAISFVLLIFTLIFSFFSSKIMKEGIG